MGTQDSRALDKRDAAAKKRNKRVASRRGEAETFEADGRSWMHVMALAVAMSTERHALRIGVTRDGGALALGMYVGDEYGTEYVKPTEDLIAAIDEIIDAWCPECQAAYERTLVSWGAR